MREVPQEQLDAEVRRIALSMYDRTFIAGYGYIPGYSRLMNAGAIARRAWTSVDASVRQENARTPSPILTNTTTPPSDAHSRAAPSTTSFAPAR